MGSECARHESTVGETKNDEMVSSYVSSILVNKIAHSPTATSIVRRVENQIDDLEFFAIHERQ